VRRTTAIVAYVPVLHAGYFQLFTKYRGSVIYILDRGITSTLRSLTKDLRALEPLQAQVAAEAWGLAAQVSVADEAALGALAEANFRIVLPDEDISRVVAARFFSDNPVTLEPIFLRWDRQRNDTSTEPTPDRIVSDDEPETRFMRPAILASQRSSDIWRRVGAVIEYNGQCIATTWNTGQPSEHTPWIDSDPRNQSHRGINLESSLFIHAEALAVATCARGGQALAGANLYVTTFPCPVCARLLANCGIKRCYYLTGYSRLDAVDILRSAGVELVLVT
jgi:dCMP deaminase